MESDHVEACMVSGILAVAGVACFVWAIIENNPLAWAMGLIAGLGCWLCAIGTIGELFE